MSRSAQMRTGSRAGSENQGAVAGLFGAPLSFSGGYLQRSQLPLMSLAFLLPFIAFYELGTTYLATDAIHHTERRILAFTLLQDFFQFCHASGRFLPALAVSLILICWHIARKDPWKLDFQTPVLMLAECVVLALPLLALAARYGFHGIDSQTMRIHIVASIGAGIYEELVFRLMAFALLSFILVDLLKIEETWAVLVIVCVAAFLFSAYHYLGSERFDLATFLFRSVGGIYFGLLFVTRGFGITAGSHACYDVLFVIISACSHVR